MNHDIRFDLSDDPRVKRLKAKQLRQRLKLRQKLRSEATAHLRPTWRDMPPICRPGWLVSKGIDAITTPLLMAGPEAVRLLEPYAEQLCGIPNPSFLVRLKRDAVLWLIEEREIAPQAKEGESDQYSFSPDDEFEQMALRLGKQMRSGCEPDGQNPSDQALPTVPDEASSDPRQTQVQGVR